MKVYSYLIKPASSSCNMACSYCFYADVSKHRSTASHGIMTASVRALLIDRMLACEADARIHLLFQGGEPTLAGLDFFKAFIKTIHQKKKNTQTVTYAIQTNGLLIDADWCRFFKINHFLVGLSLDGYPENHDDVRRTTDGQTTWQRIMQIVRLFDLYNIDYNIVTVLTATLAKHPKQLYTFYRSNNFAYVQLIPCLPPLSDASTHDSNSSCALTPRLFTEFYKVFYDLWLADFIRGDYMSVTLFDSLIPMLRGIAPSQCGYLGFCTMQCVVESDGTVYPCDFYVLDQYNCGNIRTDDFETIRHGAITKAFLSEPRSNTCNVCDKCPFFRLCYGQCKRMAPIYHTETYCGYQDFLYHALPSMQKIAVKLYH